jgi:hypothetical protein
MARTATATSRDMQFARKKARENYIEQYGVSPPANAQVNITVISGGLYKADISVPDPTAMEAVGKYDVGGAGLAEALEVVPEVQPSGSGTLQIPRRELEIDRDETFVAEADKPSPDSRSGIITTQEAVYDRTPLFPRTKTVQLTLKELLDRLGPKHLGDLTGVIPTADLSEAFKGEAYDPHAKLVAKPVAKPVEEPVAPPVALGKLAPAAPAAAEAGPSFLSRLGGAIKNNPMIASQIAQVVGGIGSGVLGGRRMAKEQAKSARRQREAMNMANAISTLTRGRTQPAVAPRPVISKPGGAETIFDILGTLGQGGAQITQGVQQREEAAEDRRRLKETEEFRKTYMMRDLDIKETEAQARTEAAAAQRSDALAKVAEKEAKRKMAEFEKLNEGMLRPKHRQQLIAFLDKLESIFTEGDFTQTGRLSIERTWGEGGKIQAEFDSIIKLMFGRMNELMVLGRMSDKDIELIKDALPDRNHAYGRVRGRIAGVKFALETMTGAAPPGTGAVPEAGGDYANMSDSKLADYLDENTDEVSGEFIGDPKALAVFNERSSE